MRLNEIQEQFKDLMLDDPALLEAVPDDFASVFEEGDIALAERLKVYRSNIVGGITDNFAKTFPLLDKLVGEDFLKQMVRAFVMKHPPSAGCLNHYGEEFPDFIRNYEPAQELPYLPDMAALELALNTAYNAPDDEALSADSLSALAPEALGAARFLPAQLFLVGPAFWPGPLISWLTPAFLPEPLFWPGQLFFAGAFFAVAMIYCPSRS